MSSKTAPKSRLKFGWLPRSIFSVFWINFRDMWEDKTMKKHGRVFKIKLCRHLDPTQFQNRFWDDFESKLEPISALKSSKNLLKNYFSLRKNTI